MENWRRILTYDPISSLLLSNNKVLVYFTQKILLDQKPRIINIQKTPQVKKIINKQRDEGSWKPSKKTGYPPDNKVLVETFKNIRILVRTYKLKKSCASVKKAADYLFKWQTKVGDFRGFIGDQYAPYYTGEILAILTLARYTNDTRIHRGINWLLEMRQNDGGWTVPILTHKLDRDTSLRATSEPWETLEPIRDMPFSHNWTEMSLRPIAVHPSYKYNPEARKAATLLKSRFFKPDVYGSYRDKEYWVRFRFWWSNLVTSLDSLSLMGYRIEDNDISCAKNWLISNQMPNGLWKTSYKK